MSDDLERAARAIMDDEIDRHGAHDIDRETYWRQHEGIYFAQARAVIASMMEPSEDILFVANQQLDECAENECGDAARHVWKAMLSTILDEKGKE